MIVRPPGTPLVRLTIGVTGHRAVHPDYAANAAGIESTLRGIFDLLDSHVGATAAPFGAVSAATRLHSLLVDGADQVAADLALARGWELVSPLPFGRSLNEAINALPETTADARALLAGASAAETATEARAHKIRTLYGRARLFELADNDKAIERLLLGKLDAPENAAALALFSAECAARVALANRVMVEQSDIIVAIWDGSTTAHVGGTGHTIELALELGGAVIWIDPASPADWRILRSRESLAARGGVVPDAHTVVGNIVDEVLRSKDAMTKPRGDRSLSVDPLAAERWPARSNPLWQAYRRVEYVFGGQGGFPLRSLTVAYETPDRIGAGTGSQILEAARKLPGADPKLGDRLDREILHRFAWSDGVSAHLSDTYRGGMVANFMLAALAVVAGVAYQPFGGDDKLGVFAATELALLGTILVVTFLGKARHWHARWFETRRVAEYLRHSPLLLTLGVARPPGRWPKGMETSWPEWYVQQSLRGVGLPEIAVTKAYLRMALERLVITHVASQRDYHRKKARRLKAVERNLDIVSQFMFGLAIISVSVYFALKVTTQIWPPAGVALGAGAEVFTLLGVLLPTFGASVSGIRFFGDFERFAAISEVTAEKLDVVHARIALLLAAGDNAIDFGGVADIAHAADAVVVSEIESWQAVFGGKDVTLPA